MMSKRDDDDAFYSTLIRRVRASRAKRGRKTAREIRRRLPKVQERDSMCALRATTTTTTSKRREREKKKYRLRCNNTNDRKSSALRALFRFVRALGVAIGFKRVTPFPNPPNYLGSQNRCVFSPKISPSFFYTKKRAQKSLRFHVLSSPPTRERVFPRVVVFRVLVVVAIVAVAHHHHQSFLGGVFSRRLCVDAIR